MRNCLEWVVLARLNDICAVRHHLKRKTTQAYVLLALNIDDQTCVLVKTMLDQLSTNGLLKLALLVSIVLNLKNLLFVWHVSPGPTQLSH